MKVMLPILRTSGINNMPRNEAMARKLSEEDKTKLKDQIIHSHVELADFSI